jgi:thiamine biosynthesis lipoprotein
MRRREFLHPNQLTQTAGQILATLDGAVPPAEPALTLLRFGRRAMATSFEIAMPLGTRDAHAAAADGLELIDRLEAQLTVYREDSDVSRINRHAADGAMPVESLLFELLQRAERIHAETDGAYDIAIGALIKTWGFFRRQGRVPADAERAAALAHSGMCHVLLDSEQRRVRFATRGVEINLGSIGKGYALDHVVQRLRTEWNIPAGLVHGGTSSVAGFGSPAAPARGWTVGLGHPGNLKRRLGVVWLRDRALGTSSATFQHLIHEGRKLGHILDPRTGWPAEQLASATALAPTAAQADALATAFFVLGEAGTRVYCQKHPEIGAVLLPLGNRAAPLAIGNVEFAS